MKSRILSFILCLIVLAGTVLLIRSFPLDPVKETFIPATETITLEETGESDTNTRSFVIETAHDAEDLIRELAFGQNKNYETQMRDLALRLDQSSDYLKNSLQDFYGASYFSKISDIFEEVVSVPFTDSSSFSTRVAKMLTELENSYPADVAANLDEKDPVSPMYYPKFDTTANGPTTLALLSIYRQQYQKSTGSILLTFAGNTLVGDSLLESDSENSFKSQVRKNTYSYPLYRLSSVLCTDGASFANLEVPLTNSIIGSVAGSVKGLPEYASLLKNGGLDVLSVSSPGVLTFGDSGKEETLKALKDTEIAYTDLASVHYQSTSLGIVAYITYDIIDEIQGNVNLTYQDAPKQDIAAAKSAGAKFVIVNFNWINTEDDAWDPCMSQVLTARAAVDNGADLVIGTHPDVAEAIERYKGVSIVYCPGTLTNKNSSGGTSFLFQQAFSLDADGNAQRGEIQVFPIVFNENGAPALVLDSSSVDGFGKELVNISRTVRYGVGKRAEFVLKDLNLISVEK